MPEVKKAVAECFVERRLSKKSGSEYEVLVLEFENGFKMDVFMTNEQKFILSSVVPLLV